MKIGSLFSGVGGLDMAVEKVFGGTQAWFSEVNPAASKVLAHRFPGVPNLGDITKIDWQEVEPVDVLCGGFPCQDLSSAGKRAGIKDGTRSGLWAVFAEAIDVLRPQYVVIENVRGLLSAAAHRTVEDDAGNQLELRTAAVGNRAVGPVLRAAGAVLGDLADIGYDAQWATVAAAAVGAPHRRERVFIVAYAGGAAVVKPARGSLAEETGAQSGDRSGDCGGERTPRDGRQACVCGCRRIDHDWFANPGRFDDGGCRRCRCESFRPNNEPGVALLPTPSTHDKTGARSPESIARMDRPFGNLNDTEVNELLPTPVSRDGKDTHSSQRMADKSKLTGIAHLLPTPEAKNSHAGPDFARMNRKGSGGHDLVTAVAYHNVSESAWGKYEPAIRRWEQVTAQPAPPPTEPNKNGKQRLSAAFSEWLMGWPAGWVTDPAIGLSRSNQLLCIGNGVVPQQAESAISYLLAFSDLVSP